MLNPSRILVPVAGNPLDEEMVAYAAELAKRSHARLYSIYVIEVKRTLPLEIDLPAEVEKGEEILQRAEEVARRSKQDIETEVLQARDAGTAIVEEAERRGIDLIVMGLRYRKQYEQFYLGSTVMYVLKNASSRVCVCREPIP
ncbi:MAG: universal stress protein [Chloroflexi bacterium]|nr:universal stress protein [Chloroflexota bacterium]